MTPSSLPRYPAQLLLVSTQLGAPSGAGTIGKVGGIRDWEPDLMGLGPNQGSGSGKVAEKVGGFKSGVGGVWPGRPPPSPNAGFPRFWKY